MNRSTSAPKVLATQKCGTQQSGIHVVWELASNAGFPGPTSKPLNQNLQEPVVEQTL